MAPRLHDKGNHGAWLVIAFAFLLSCTGAFFSSQGDLASSRLATVYSLTTHHTWYIDQPDNRFAGETIDRVVVRGTEENGIMRGGRMISSKPPVMPLVMTGIYVIAHPLTGWGLESSHDIDRLLVLMTILLVSCSFLVTLVFFLKTLSLFELQYKAELYLIMALALGTQVAGYSITINNHVPAAGALMLAIYLALGLIFDKHAPSIWRFLLFGFAGALVPTIDMPAGIYVAALGCALLAKFPKHTLLWSVCGGALPLLVHFGATYAVTGSFLPVQMRDATYMYESAYWRHPLGIDALSEPKLVYLFHTTFGRCGVFLLFPVLILGLIGFVMGARSTSKPMRRLTMGCLACFLLLVAYYVRSTHNYGGESYGFRWYIASMPVLLLVAIPVVTRISTRWQWGIALLLLTVSMYSTFESAYVGWESGREWTSRVYGRAYEQVNPDPR